MKSKYRGVCWRNQNNKWLAYITVDKKRHHLGYFESEKEAATAYNTAARKYLGGWANLNVL